VARVLIILGHPDADPARFCRALAQAYAGGAREGRHEVRLIDLGAGPVPLLRSRAEWEAPTAPAIAAWQDDIAWAEHLVFVYPLWLGALPAVLKGFLEQVLRPDPGDAKALGRRLAGKTARIVVTMGMPALLYRWWFRALTLRALERNILRFCGCGRIRETVIGLVESGGPARHQRLLARMRALGRQAR
jgi:putative NADPH-quinone reductase